MSIASNSDRPEGCLSPKEFARRAFVSKSTVDRYLNQGLLTKVQRKKGYRVWIPERELYSANFGTPFQPLPDSDARDPDGIPEEEAANPLPGKIPAWMNPCATLTKEVAMPKHKSKGDEPEKYPCQFFDWPIYQRSSGVWYADGRSNGASLKRTSLGTKDRDEAIANLHQLDRIQAENLGLVPRTRSNPADKRLALSAGRKLFDAHNARPILVGGTKPSTRKRYRAILDKFLEFAPSERISEWNQVTERTLAEYAKHLDDLGYARKTIYGELNLLKTAFKWLCREGHIDRKPLKLKLRKAECERAYCYTSEEVNSMLQHCANSTDLGWLYSVIVALACTGLRISELASLKWSDIRFSDRTLTIADESGFSGQRANDRRTTKSSRSRHIPLRTELQVLLQSLPQTDTYVFRGPRGGRLKPDTVRNILVREVIEKLSPRFPKKFAGQRSFEDGRLHSLRHYFCSVCANTAIPERIVMEWLGHADSEMVRHYYHLSDEESRRKMDQLPPIGIEPNTSEIEKDKGEGDNLAEAN
ncbi:Tyrosine recombinase XerC [Novipirellula aureliae]|uniref:Tyrosine recombinase XerC n=1 Tax=Novipirellula aureliae TaxID=2527966 RepID=A0A5C6DYE4_9BACT|nr:tyrosine-type recombinase/integrase [Novipirellula aureliae]TWU39889.1 Tyrosine recombinase XerC [Novipirellula aureliae]